MKTTHTFEMRRFILILFLSAGLSFVAPVFADSFIVDLNSRNVAVLGSLGMGGTVAQGINDAGQVVGSSPTVGRFGVENHAFITGPNGKGMTDLDLGNFGGDNSYAPGINAAGQVVVNSLGYFGVPGGASHAFISGPNGVGMTNLGTLGGDSSYAIGINDTGQVAGISVIPVGLGEPPLLRGGGDTHIFITGPNGAGMTDLGDLGGRDAQPSGINASGQLAGTGGAAEAHYAFITGPNGAGMTDLGTLGGNNSFAFGINDAGQVVGYSLTAAGSYHAFITGPNGVGMTDLGTLGGSFSKATGVNADGQVVGYSSTAAGSYHAFVTGPHGVGMSDLNTLVNVPDGVILTDATGINNLGQVIAVTTAVPEPEIYALLLAGLGLIGFVACRREFA